MTKFIDTHAHLYLKHFAKDLQQVINRAKEKLHAVILPNIDVQSVEPLKKLVEKHPKFFYAGIGLHPTSVNNDYIQQLKTLEALLDTFPNLVAIGEIGLDFYWDKSFTKQQIDALLTQINWAIQKNLPIILHARNSIDELINIVEKQQDGNLKGVFHCFTGDLQQAKKIIDMNFYLGIGGIFTFKKSNLPEIIEQIGLHNIVLETDSPYLTPVPYRGKRNESAYTYFVAKSVAEKLNIPLQIVAQKTNHNAIKLFNLQPKSTMDVQ